MSHRESQSLRKQLKSSLNAATYALITHIVAVAGERGYRAFLVGGPVRDLLLGIPQSDIDLVFEGEAIPLGHQLERELGGHAITHPRFGTVKWVLDDAAHPPTHRLTRAKGLPPFIDLITARRERYEHPAALPDVRFSTMPDDLFRRDFTINTLALALNGPHEGQLLDLYGGMDDLRAGRIRVLHNRSFIDDPTRIFRALRFICRLRFTFEPQTEVQLRDAIPLLERLSPDRVRHELLLVLEEPCAIAIFDLMAQWGIFPLIFPGVVWGAVPRAKIEALLATGERDPLPLIAALLWGAAPESIAEVAERLGFPLAWRNPLHALAVLRGDRTLARPALKNSALYFRLRNEPPLAIEWLARLTDDATLRERARLFLDDLRHREMTVSGDNLKALGVRPGPIYQTLLDDVRAALMDSDAPGQLDQAALLKRAVRKRIG